MSTPDLDGYTLATRQLVMYPDLNAAGRLFGGQLMSWIDEGAAMVAMQIMGTERLVTKTFGEIVFDAPGCLGDVVEVWCRTLREGRTSLSMECRVVVRSSSSASGNRLRQISSSTVVYVALDADGRPKPWRTTG